MNFILIAIVLAILMTIFWVVLIIFSRKSDIEIEVTDFNRKITKYRGKFLLEGEPKTEKIQIRNKLKETIPIWKEHFIYEGKKPKLRVFRDQNGDYNPIITVWDDVEKKLRDIVDNKDMKFWFVVETRERLEKYQKKKNNWEKAAPIIAIIVIGLIAFFTMYWSNNIQEKTLAASTQEATSSLNLRLIEANNSAEATAVLKEFKPILERFLKAMVQNQNAGVVNG